MNSNIIADRPTHRRGHDMKDSRRRKFQTTNKVTVSLNSGKYQGTVVNHYYTKRGLFYRVELHNHFKLKEIYVVEGQLEKS